MSRRKQSAEAPSAREDATDISAFLRQMPRTAADLASVMHWDRPRVDRTLGVMVSDGVVVRSAANGEYSLVDHAVKMVTV